MITEVEEFYPSMEEQNTLNYIQLHFATSMELDIEYSAYFMIRYGLKKLLEIPPTDAILQLKYKFMN